MLAHSIGEYLSFDRIDVKRTRTLSRLSYDKRTVRRYVQTLPYGSEVRKKKELA
jgi:hypothetical protein